MQEPEPDYEQREFTKPAQASEEAKRLWRIARTLLLNLYRRRTSQSPEPDETRPSKVLEQIAIVISKTYAVRCDDFQLADDEALRLINDLLVQYSSNIVERNKRKKTPRIKYETHTL